jgi:hypothetical protein
MLYEFKCRATASVVMTDGVGRKMLEVIGKEDAARGVITVGQLPGAIASLKAAIAAEREEIAQALAQPRPKPGDALDDTSHESTPESVAAIRFSQRAMPLIEMFERAHAAGRDVTWGV